MKSFRRFASPVAVFLWAALFVLTSTPAHTSAKVKVAASTTDLASIASSVGGDEVEVFAVARPTADPHRVEVLPSYMVQVSRANLYLKVGLQLDQWADGIIDGSRNAKLRVVDCSKGITPLEKPTSASAAQGDVHPFGNPHYWLDPRNGAIVARTIADELAHADPAHADAYHQRAEAFAGQVDASFKRGQAIVAKMPVKTILTYHRSWSYLGDAFGLEIADTVEPLPGIPPTAKHLQDLVQLVKERKISVLLQEPYFSEDGGKFLNRESGLRVVKASSACDAPTAGSYLAHIEDVLNKLAGNGSS